MKRKVVLASQAICVLLCAAPTGRAADIYSLENAPPSAYVVELGGYGVLAPAYEGSNHYVMSFKPIFYYTSPGDRQWLSFPNDAIDINLYETSNFRAGPAASITLQSRYHGEDIDLRLGKADVDLQTGAFAEYYPLANVRTRVEVLQGITGNPGLAANLAADYIWRPAADWTLTLGPRAQIVNDEYASAWFSTENAKKTGTYVPFRAEGGVLYAGAEFTGKYDWSKEISGRFYMDYDQLMGDAADSPRVSIRGSSEQFIVGAGISYKFAIEP